VPANPDPSQEPASPETAHQRRVAAYLAAAKRPRKPPPELSPDEQAYRYRRTTDRIRYGTALDDDRKPLKHWPNGPRPPKGWENYYAEDVANPEELQEWLAREVDALQHLDNFRERNDNPGQSVRNACRLIDKLGLASLPALLEGTQALTPLQEIARLRVVQDGLSQYAPAMSVVPVQGSVSAGGRLIVSVDDYLPAPVPRVPPWDNPPKNDGGQANAPGATGIREQTDRAAQAMALVLAAQQKGVRIRKMDIALAVGVNRTTMYRSPEFSRFHALWDAYKTTLKASPPRGYINAKGNLEAVE